VHQSQVELITDFISIRFVDMSSFSACTKYSMADLQEANADIT